jgi:PEP-CTERM motif
MAKMKGKQEGVNKSAAIREILAKDPKIVGIGAADEKVPTAGVHDSAGRTVAVPPGAECQATVLVIGVRCAAPVPEPSTLVLLATLVVIGWTWRRR